MLSLPETATTSNIQNLFSFAEKHGIAPSAHQASSLGFFLIPLSDEKDPLFSWKHRNGVGKNGWTGALREDELHRFNGVNSAGFALGGLSGEREHFVVLDCDSPAAVSYVESILPGRTLSVNSSKGKRHYYFSVPAGEKVKTTYWRDGTLTDTYFALDLKADGGYVCMPGSRHPKGHRYLVHDDVPPLPLGSLLDVVRKAWDEKTRNFKWRRQFAAKPANVKGKDSDSNRERRIRTAKKRGLTEDEMRTAAEEAGWDFDAVFTAMTARRQERALRLFEKRTATPGPYVPISGSTIDEIRLEVLDLQEGNRNVGFNSACFKAFLLGASHEDVETALGSAAIDVGVPGWEATLESAFRGAQTALEDTRRDEDATSLFLALMPSEHMKAAKRLLNCSQIYGLGVYQDDGSPAGMVTYRCNDPLCLTCTKTGRYYAEKIQAEQWPEQVTLLSGLTRKAIHNASGQQVSVLVTPDGVLGVVAGEGSKAKAMKTWNDARERISADWERLLHQDPEAAAAEFVRRRETRKNFFSRGPKALPSGWGKKDVKRAREIRRAESGVEPVERGRPIETTVFRRGTGKIIAVLPYWPTSIDMQILVDQLE